MGGQSSSQQQSQTVSQPWQPAQPALTNLLGQISGVQGNTGPNPTELGAFNQLQQNAYNGNPWTAQIGQYASNLLGGGGATDQAGNVQNNLSAYQAALTPWINGSMGDPSKNPALAQALQTVNADTTNSINQQFAGAGRDLSGMNQQAIARGLAQGEAPLLLNAQQAGLNAANNLYQAGNTTSGILSGLQQQSLANQGVGVPATEQALEAQNYGPNQTLNIQSALRNLPLGTLQSLSSLLVPIAGLGGQVSSNASGTQQMSGAQQFGLIAGGLGSLFKSDRWTKTHIEKICVLHDLNVYRFRYKGEPGWRIGYMSDDVPTHAVRRTLLHDYVDYAKVA